MTETVRARLPGAFWLAAALPLALLGALYAPVWPEWASDLWNDPDYSHGLLVPFVSAWLVYERRAELARLPPRPSLSGVVLLLLGVGVLLAGLLAAEFFLTRVSLIVLLAGLVVLNLGFGHLRLLALPIGFLFFAIPLPAIVLNAITFPLQLIASKLAIATLHAIEVPSLREGNVILLPNTSLEVAEASSGLRSLVALTATSVLVATLMLRSLPARLFLIALSVPIAVVLNGLRVAGTGFLAYHVGAGAAEGFFHGFSGWVVFVAALATIALSTWPLRRLEERT